MIMQEIPTNNTHKGESFHSYQDKAAIKPINKKNDEPTCLNNIFIIDQNAVALKTRAPYNLIWQLV